MSVAARPVIAPFGWSVALHAAIAGLLLVSLNLWQEEPLPMILPIEAVVVDRAMLEAAGRRQQDVERREAERLRQEQAVAESKRREREALEKQEADRQAEEQRIRETELAAKRKAEAEAAAEAAARRKAEQQAQAKAAADKKRAADEARQRAASEADLRARLAAEEQRTSAAAQGQMAEYVRMLQAHVENRWYEPPGTAPGVRCVVHVQQIPGGEVVGVRFGECNGGAAFRQSIDNAVRNASPLPPPPNPAQFEREVRLVFTPQVKR